MNGATTIQERLKDLRLNKGLKLEELAEQTGISKSALGSYEKDDYKEINHCNIILSHMVLDDLSLIIRDIREAHKKDSESTPQTAVAWFVGFHVAAVRAVVIQLILYKAINCKLSIAT